MFEIIIGNLIKIGYAMAIFLCAYLANVVFSLWYNIKINREPFSREKLATGGLKALTFIVGLTLLCIAITTLPIFATEVGWTIPEEYAELFADLIIVGAVLLVACKYIKEAFTKFVAILNTPADIAPEKEGIDHEQQSVSNVFQDQSAPDQPPGIIRSTRSRSIVSSASGRQSKAVTSSPPRIANVPRTTSSVKTVRSAFPWRKRTVPGAVLPAPTTTAP